jgi:hypothetical protein
VVLVRKRGGKKPLGRPRLICEDNIKMGIPEIRWDVVDWINLARVRDK